MLLLKYLLFVLACTVGYSQTVYELLPGSKNNLVELSFSNRSIGANQLVSVAVQQTPEWIEFNNDQVNIENIKTLQKQTAQFSFNVLENAPIGEEGSITFRISNGSAGVITKTYNIQFHRTHLFR